MSPKKNQEASILNPAAEEPITDYEMVMAKIDNDAHKSYKGIENIALKNPDAKKQDDDEVKP